VIELVQMADDATRPIEHAPQRRPGWGKPDP
jgi:hypothetical protein